jgi:hypothetical protein
LNLPLIGLAAVMALALGSLVWSFIEKLAASGSLGLDAIYSTLRETLIQGQLTALVFTTALIVSIILMAFYFASQQSKRHYEDIYILLNRMDARLKAIERESKR